MIFAFGERKLCAARMLSSRLNLSLRQNKNSSFPGHAPGKDTLRAANAAMKERFTGRKQNKRKRILLSSRHSPKRGLTGENARANAVSRRALSPVKIKFPVASADMRRHSDTLRGAQRRRKRGLRGENRISVSEFCCLPVKKFNRPLLFPISAPFCGKSPYSRRNRDDNVSVP